MSLALLLIFQAAAPSVAPSGPGIAAIDFDLRRVRRYGVDPLTGRLLCDRSDPSAITVCAPRARGAYPLEEMARLFEPGRIVAEMQLAPGVVGDVHVEAGPTSDRGVTPNRAMVRVRVPF